MFRTQDYKENLESIAEGYQTARDCEFDTKLTDFIRKTRDSNGVVTEDGIQGFLDDFNFPDENEWSEKEYADQIGSYEDEKYEEARDIEMGL